VFTYFLAKLAHNHHSSDVDLRVMCIDSKEKNKKVMAAPIGALYYSMIYGILDRYEQLLTAIELTITNFEQRNFYTGQQKRCWNISIRYLDK